VTRFDSPFGTTKKGDSKCVARLTVIPFKTNYIILFWNSIHTLLSNLAQILIH